MSGKALKKDFNASPPYISRSPLRQKWIYHDLLEGAINHDVSIYEK